jgi:hypothetical protein
MLKHQTCDIEQDHVSDEALKLVAIIGFNLVIKE